MARGFSRARTITLQRANGPNPRFLAGAGLSAPAGAGLWVGWAEAPPRLEGNRPGHTVNA